MNKPLTVYERDVLAKDTILESERERDYVILTRAEAYCTQYAYEHRDNISMIELMLIGHINALYMAQHVLELNDDPNHVKALLVTRYVTERAFCEFIGAKRNIIVEICRADKERSKLWDMVYDVYAIDCGCI